MIPKATALGKFHGTVQDLHFWSWLIAKCIVHVQVSAQL